MDVTRSVTDGVATLQLDDGKVNALDIAALQAIDLALDGCANDRAVVLAGRDGVFSAGLDRRLLDGSADDLRALAAALTRTTVRLWTEPRPVVAAATGHAIAAGTILALACDHVIATEGDFRWGLNETAIGLVLPRWVVDLARANLRADRLERLLLPGRLVTAREAVDVGFADELAPADEIVDRAVTRALALAELPRAAYAANKYRLRGAAADAALLELDRGAPAIRPEGAAGP